jgi:hypothetical protein
LATASTKHTWAFATRFRSGAFGWKSEPAITRIKEALSEIKAVAKKDPILAAEGAVLFLRKLSPALQNIDSSSGAIGNAVNHAIEALVPIIAMAQADPQQRRQWLEALFEALQDDQIPYIELLGDFWGELCASPDLAAEWADRLAGTVESIWSRPSTEFAFFSGTSAALSALLAAGDHDRLLSLLAHCRHPFWSYRRWGVRALIEKGKAEEALRLAEATQGVNEPVGLIAETCEAILLSLGRTEDAYRRYAIESNTASTYLATYRNVCKKYPAKQPREILSDLVRAHPGQEGKWFAAAKDAGQYDLALDLARKSPVDHRTLIRAAKDFNEKQPAFAMHAGMLVIHWICAGRAYDVTSAEVLSAYDLAMAAAERLNCREKASAALEVTLGSFPGERNVRSLLESRLRGDGHD